METVTDFLFSGSKITADGGCSHEIKRHLLLGRKAMINLDSILKNRDITLPTKVHLVKAMVFPVAMYGCESWTINKALHQKKLMLLNCGIGEDSWESLGLQGDPTSPSWRKSVLNIHWKDWSWSSNTWPSDAKSWLIIKDPGPSKDPDPGKDWRQEEKGTTEYKMVGRHYWLYGHEIEQAPGVGDGEGSLACCSTQGRKKSDTTEWLNWTELNWIDTMEC